MELMKGLEILGKYGFKPFDSTDWDGYAGAESFSNEVEPFYGSMERNNFDLEMVIDKSGMEITFSEKDPLAADETYRRNGTLEECLMFLSIIGFLHYNKEEMLWVLREFFERTDG